MNKYRPQTKAVFQLVALMACLQAIAASKNNTKTITTPNVPMAGIIVGDVIGQHGIEIEIGNDPAERS